MAMDAAMLEAKVAELTAEVQTLKEGLANAEAATAAVTATAAETEKQRVEMTKYVALLEQNVDKSMKALEGKELGAKADSGIVRQRIDDLEAKILTMEASGGGGGSRGKGVGYSRLKNTIPAVFASSRTGTTGPKMSKNTSNQSSQECRQSSARLSACMRRWTAMTRMKSQGRAWRKIGGQRRQML